MKLVFVLQWADPIALRNFQRRGVLHYPYERMEKMLSDAYEAGRKVGDNEGRVALRKLLDEENLLR